ncbi:VWA domain-containing protein, partial [Candidatus Woesearchaeota archaeon]|nr:VWA domain-containing protein [Candidatus Woesearchaeota archaeon]
MAMKKGIFFTIDALLAASVLLMGIIILSSAYINKQQAIHLNYLSQDIINSLNNLKINELNNSYVDELIANGNITDINNSILQQVGEFWAFEKFDIARSFIDNITYNLLPERLGFGIWVSNDLIYTKNKSSYSSRASARTMISGYERKKPIDGTSSRAYLESIREKKTAAYAYFGGFVGQGNISKQLEFIPSDAVIVSSFIELDAGNDFDLYINENFCSSFTPILNNMSSTRWNISSCNNLFLNNTRNNISLYFSGDLNKSYAAGGYVKVEYRTQEFIQNKTPGIEYYYFPGIRGIINLYSSFDIPGTLNSIDIYLHFYNNGTTYLNIGNETMFTGAGSSSDQIVNLTNISLELDPQTIPIRMGVNISEAINITSGEPSDSVLVTDVSGSMDDCGEYAETEICQYECCGFWFFGCWWWFTRDCPYTGSCSGDECGTCASGRTRNHQVLNGTTCINTKMELAKEADLEFIDVVLNLTGNKVGLVSYDSSVDSVEPITDIKINLENEINSYSAGGGTCICCGINRAKNMLVSSSNNKFMVVMSDGQATHYCSDFDDYTGTSGSGASASAISSGQNACS